MRVIRFGLSVLLLCMVPFVVVAGGRGEPARAEGVVDLTLAVSAGTLSADTLDRALQEFHRQHPNIRVSDVVWVTYSDWPDFFTQMRALIAGGNPPDVIRVVIEGLPFMIQQNMALPLNEYLDKYPEYRRDYDDLHPNLQGVWEVDGNIYGYSWDWNNVATHINLDMLEAAGLPFPSSDWDMDTFLRYARTLTREVDGNKVYGITIRPNFFTVSAVLYNFGAQFLTDDMTRSALDTPEALEAFQFLYDLVYTYEVSPRPDPAANYIAQFVTGQVAMAVGTGRSPIRTWIENDINFDIQFVPSFRTNQVIFGSGAWPVLRMSRNPEEAFLLSAFLGSVFSQTEILDTAGIPTRISVMDSQLPTAPPANSMMFRQSADIARSVQAPAEYVELGDIFHRHFSRLMANEVSVREAVSTMDREFNEVLSRRR